MVAIISTLDRGLITPLFNIVLNGLSINPDKPFLIGFESSMYNF